MKTHLLIIDPQNSFCHPKGELYVPGAQEDSKRLSNYIKKNIDKIDEIHVTLDSHQEVDIAHPIFWVNSKNEHPSPFTIISRVDVENGVWRTTNPSCLKIAKNYVTQLEKNARYPLCIWPPHCIIGKNDNGFCGHAIESSISEALTEWSIKRFKRIDFVTKGSNPFTEHYSAVKADVIDPSDPTTHLNTGLINTLAAAHEIIITGQALSHCVRFTIMDIAAEFGNEACKKFKLLGDTSSSVPGFEKNGEDFKSWLLSVGGSIINTTDI